MKNKASLAELIVDFFEYYAKFDWENDVISVRLGRTAGMHDANLLKPGNAQGLITFIFPVFLSNFCFSIIFQVTRVWSTSTLG